MTGCRYFACRHTGDGIFIFYAPYLHDKATMPMRRVMAKVAVQEAKRHYAKLLTPLRHRFPAHHTLKY